MEDHHQKEPSVYPTLLLLDLHEGLEVLLMQSHVMRYVKSLLNNLTNNSFVPFQCSLYLMGFFIFIHNFAGEWYSVVIVFIN